MRTEDGYVIQQCLDGKPGAFGFLVEKYKKGVYALAYSEIRNFHDAQDIAQEVFIKAFRNLHTLKRWDNFMGWLCRITLNTCKNWIRTASRRPDSEYMEDQEQSRLDHSAIESYNEDIVNESVREALDSLPEIYRQVLSLRYFGGMTVSEISEFLSVPKRTIDRRISEAQAKLREEIPAMLDTVKIRHDLPAGFTFHIVEIVKGIRIHPIPPIKVVPLGLSLAIGIIAGFLSIGTHLNFTETINTFISSSGESKVLDVGEYPVDVMKVSNVSVMSKGQMNGDGLGSVVPSLQNALLMAPQAEGGTWTKKASMLTPRWALSTSVVNGKIYAIGGGDDNNKPTSTVEEYDPATNTWKKKSDMPTPRWRLTTSVVNGKIYAIGGEKEKDVTPVVEEYDPIKDKWEKKGNIPKQWKYHFSSNTVNGKIYIIGGEPKDLVGHEVEEYDPTNDTWTRKAEMPTARDNLSTSVINGKIYAIGGVGMDAPWQLSVVEEYDPISDKWTKKADMPTARYHLSTAVMDGKIFSFGGINNNAPWFCSMVEEYDPITDTWIKKSDMPAERGALSVSAVNNRIYVIGGYNKVGGADHIFSEVEEYNPSPKGESINFKGKLPTTWGETKTALNR